MFKHFRKIFTLGLLIFGIQTFSFGQIKEIYEGLLGEEVISIGLAISEGGITENGVLKPGVVIIPESWTTDKLMGSSKNAVTVSGDMLKFEGLTFDNETGDHFTVYFNFKRTLKTSSLQDYCADIEGTLEYTFNGVKKTLPFKASMVYCD